MKVWCLNIQSSPNLPDTQVPENLPDTAAPGPGLPHDAQRGHKHYTEPALSGNIILKKEMLA